MSSHPPPPPPKFIPRSTSNGTHPLSQLARHGKYVLAGVVGCWYTNVVGLVMDDLLAQRYGPWSSTRTQGGGGGVRSVGKGYKMMITSLGLQAVTIAIFLYLVIFLPWIRGVIPNYPSWQRSQRLRIIMPLLTTTIITGYTTLVLALVRGTGLGAFQSFVAATSVYLLTFGLLGLIPSPAPPIVMPDTSDAYKGRRRD